MSSSVAQASPSRPYRWVRSTRCSATVTTYASADGPSTPMSLGRSTSMCTRTTRSSQWSLPIAPAATSVSRSRCTVQRTASMPRSRRPARGRSVSTRSTSTPAAISYLHVVLPNDARSSRTRRPTMTVLVVLESIVLALLIALVIGLLRTHAEVLRRLHELGAGIYDTEAARTSAADLSGRVADGVAAPRADTAPRAVVVDITGVTPRGSAVSVSVGGDGRLTLLAFLSSGCTTCADFWRAWRAGESPQL